MKQKKSKIFHKRLTKLRSKASSDLEKKHSEAVTYLKKEKKLLLPTLREHSTKLLTGATLAGSLLLTPAKPAESRFLRKPPEERLKLGLVTSEEIKKLISEKISGLVPGSVGKITGPDKDKIYQVLKEVLGVDVRASLEGQELNFSFGWIGYEQHLKRYPGDNLTQHDEEKVAGIAPGLGAWGHFASSKAEMTEELYLMEKYYVAVQTMYLPEWGIKTKELSKWYKYRKVIVVNPENGSACVGVVADAGPAAWTGKQFGGSPELMKEVDLHLGPRKGKVLLLFVEDPEGNVPLGPIDFNIKTGKPETA